MTLGYNAMDIRLGSAHESKFRRTLRMLELRAAADVPPRQCTDEAVAAGIKLRAVIHVPRRLAVACRTQQATGGRGQAAGIFNEAPGMRMTEHHRRRQETNRRMATRLVCAASGNGMAGR